jgi:hypothetical protein
MKREAVHHTKMGRLMRRLKAPRPLCMGYLELLWHLTANEAPAGDIGRKGDEDIAVALEYEGEPEALIEALVGAGWLDRHPVYRLVVHDWHDHCPDWVTKRLERSKIPFASLPAPAPKESKEAARKAPALASPEPAPLPEAPKPDPTDNGSHRRTAADNGSHREKAAAYQNQPPNQDPRPKTQPTSESLTLHRADMRGPPPGSGPPKPGSSRDFDVAGWLAGPDPPGPRELLARLGVYEPALSALVTAGVTVESAAREWAAVEHDGRVGNKPRVLAVRLSSGLGIELPKGKSLRGALGEEAARLSRLRAQRNIRAGPAP